MKVIPRKLSIILVLVLVFSTVLVGCGKKGEEPQGDKSYNIGVNTWGSGVPVLDLFGDEAEYALRALGSTTNRMSDDFTADKELQNVQNFISAGVDGICLQGAAVSTVPRISELSKNAKIPFVMHVFIGDDADRDKIADDNPYYVGAIDADMPTDGRMMAQSALRDGNKTAIMVGGNIGDNNMDQRMDGFREVFEAGGGTILDSVRCTDNSECFSKMSDSLSANRDVDCVYMVVGDYVDGTIAALGNLGMMGNVNLYMSCVDAASAQLIKDGTIIEGCDGIILPSSIAPTMLLNYLDGHKIADENGKAPRFRTTPFIVTKDNADDYMSIFGRQDVHPIPEEVLKSLCWRYNPDVTYQTYVDFINNLSLDMLLDAHK